jgi:kynurenine formamidase
MTSYSVLAQPSIRIGCCLWLVFAYSAAAALAQGPGDRRMIDLTHSYNSETIAWPTEEGFKLIPENAGVIEPGGNYAANRITCPEHCGTHLDAPRHFLETGETVDQVPLKRLAGPAACVDITQQCVADPDYQATIDDFLGWELVQGSTLDDRIVLIYTGFCRLWPNREKYLGTLEQGKAALSDLHFPGLDPAAADWLVSKRHVRLVGIDTASIDYGQSRDFATHQRLFRDGVPAIENLAHLDQLPAENFSVVALPMKIAGGSGAPCRVVAILDK